MLRADGSIRQLTHGIPSLTVGDWSLDRSKLLVTKPREGGSGRLTLRPRGPETWHTVWQHGGSTASRRWSADDSRIGFVWTDGRTRCQRTEAGWSDMLPATGPTPRLHGVGGSRPRARDRDAGRRRADNRADARRPAGAAPGGRLHRLSASVRCFARRDPGLVGPAGDGVPLPQRARYRSCAYVSPGVGSVQDEPGDGSSDRAPRTRGCPRGRRSAARWHSSSDTGLFVSPGRRRAIPARHHLVATPAPSWSADGGHMAAVVQRQAGGGQCSRSRSSAARRWRRSPAPRRVSPTSSGGRSGDHEWSAGRPAAALDVPAPTSPVAPRPRRRAAAEAGLRAGDVEARVHLDRDVGAVGVLHVGLVGGIARVGFDADHGGAGTAASAAARAFDAADAGEQRLARPMAELRRVTGGFRGGGCSRVPARTTSLRRRRHRGATIRLRARVRRSRPRFEPCSRTWPPSSVPAPGGGVGSSVAAEAGRAVSAGWGFAQSCNARAASLDVP